MSLFKWDSRKAIYRMGEVTDYSGNGNNLTVNGATPSTGQYDLDGTDDYLSAPGLVTSLANDTKGTIAMKINPDVDSGAGQRLFAVSRATDTTLTQILISINWGFAGNPIEMTCRVDGVLKWLTRGSTDMSAFIGLDTYVTVKHDGTQISEVKINNTTDSLSRADTTDETVWMKGILTDATSKADSATFGAGVSNSVYANFFNGQIGETGIFVDVWDSTDDTAFYNEGNGRVLNNLGKNNQLLLSQVS